MKRTVLLLIYEGVQPIDVAGPMQAFATADEETGGTSYRIVAASLYPGLVGFAGGLQVMGARLPRGPIHTVLIPGGPGVHAVRRDPALLAAVRRLSSRAERTCSVCTGAFLLASAGLLEGRPAVTHWRACAQLAAEFPAIQVQDDPIWVRDGTIWTSAGVTAGIDLALALIEMDLGTAIALRVARRLVIPIRRAGGQSQHSETLALQSDNQFGPLLEWIGANLSQPLTTDQLADRAGMAPRSFHRHFLASTGHTPATMVERLRLDHARLLLEVAHLPLDVVASRSGFGSAERLRRAFKRRFNIPTRDYERRLTLSPADPPPAPASGG
jgi:transcriptional regulator GlxA family with amidase domain